MKKITVNGDCFVDKKGRHVLLRGVNMVCKEKQQGYIGNWHETDFRNLHKWGFNVIRLGIIWDAIEPEPGVYDEEYLHQIRHFIQLADEEGLYIILDMHQDLFSSAYASGAPEWATITDGYDYEPGNVWSDAYLFNDAVQRAFDHFWANTAASDGIGIQDHFTQAWEYVVQQVKDQANVIGYDMINEPFIGTKGKQVIGAMLEKYAHLYGKQYEAVDLETLEASWLDENKKQKYLFLLEDLDVFKQVVSAPLAITKQFDEGHLSTLYQQIGMKIRQQDSEAILFLEANYFSNIGVESMIKPVKDQKDKKDPLQAYAPHAYDLVTDTEASYVSNDQRLRFIFNQHEKVRQRLKMPMLIGEWGAFYESDQTAHSGFYIQGLMEDLLCSDTYWDYTKKMNESLSFLSICRGYPVATAGKLMQYRYDHHLQSFHMKWEEVGEVSSPTRIYHPNISRVTEESVTLIQEGSGFRIEKIDESEAGFIIIPPVKEGIRSIMIIPG